MNNIKDNKNDSIDKISNGEHLIKENYKNDKTLKIENENKNKKEICQIHNKNNGIKRNDKYNK